MLFLVATRGNPTLLPDGHHQVGSVFASRRCRSACRSFLGSILHTLRIPRETRVLLFSFVFPDFVEHPRVAFKLGVWELSFLKTEQRSNTAS